MAKHAHELEKRWSAKVSREGGLTVTDLASGEETQASAYTHSGGEVRFAFPGDNGLRVIPGTDPSYAEFARAIDAVNGVEKPAEKAAPAEKKV